MVAIKVFRLDLTPEQSSALVAQFEQLVAKGLHHPSLAAPVATGLESGAAFLAQEYVVGESLDVVLRERGALPLPEAVRLAEAMASGIDAAADAGVRHGSLHPRDIIMASDGGDSARITGIGVADALAKIGAHVPFRPPYSSQQSPSDGYSVAAIAFEALSGRRLTEANLEELEHERGRELRGVFASAVAINPVLRPARVAEFASAVRDAVAQKVAAPITDSATPEFDPQLAEPGLADNPFDHIVDPGAVTDLRPDFPPEPEPDLADRLFDRPSFDHQPETASILEDPKVFESQEPVDEPVQQDSGGRRLFSILLICVVLVGAVFAYFVIGGRRSTNPTSTAGAKPTVAETTVELPASRQATPPANPPAAPVETRPTSTPPPPPSPSRSAAGVTRRPLGASSAAAQHGNLLIRSTPPNADVVVNGQSRGKTPLTMRDLPLGSYTIRIAREGYVPEDRRVELTSQRATAAISFSLRSAGDASGPVASGRGVASGPGTINVQSRPSGASVFVNNQLIGSTPLAVPNVPEGSATVRIEMEGYQPWTTTVQVNAGDAARVNASLDRR